MISVEQISRFVDVALKEDHANRDVTSRYLIRPSTRAIAAVVARDYGILSGTEIAAEVFRRLAPGCRILLQAKDSERLTPGKEIMTIKGKAARILAGERIAIVAEAKPRNNKAGSRFPRFYERRGAGWRSLFPSRPPPRSREQRSRL